MDQKSAFLSNFIQEDLYLIKSPSKETNQIEPSPKVLVITEAALNDEQQVFLHKVFASVGISGDQLQHVIQTEVPDHLNQVVFTFGLDMSDHHPYQQIPKQNGIQVYGHSLSELQADQAKKRALWKVLKELFA